MILYNKFVFRVLNKMISILCRNKLAIKVAQPLIKWKKKIEQIKIIDDSFIAYVQKKKAGLENHASEIEIVGMRGSLTDYGFYTPDIIHGAYNLGLTSSDLYITYYIYAHTLRKLPQLKCLVLYYGVFVSGLSLIHTNEKYRQIVYDYFFNIPTPEDITLNDGFISHIKKKCGKVAVGDIDKNYWGYERKSWFATIEAKKRVTTHLRENNREPDQLIWLTRLSKMLEEDGRSLYIVIPPFRSDYRKELPDAPTLFHKLFNLKLASHTRILNYFDSPLFDDSDFGDTEHMNEKGAMKITCEIKKGIYNREEGKE